MFVVEHKFLIDRGKIILEFTGRVRSNWIDFSTMRRKYISCDWTATGFLVSFFTRVFHRSKFIVSITQVVAGDDFWSLTHANFHS